MFITEHLLEKSLHNRLPTVPHGFLLVASLNHLAISEVEHKETIPLIPCKFLEQRKDEKTENSCVGRASWSYIACLGLLSLCRR